MWSRKSLVVGAGVVAVIGLAIVAVVSMQGDDADSVVVGAAASASSPADDPSGDRSALVAMNGTCGASSGSSSGDLADRFTALAGEAGKLLQSNGVAAGPQIATGTQITIDQAFDRASSIPGDASIVESMWLQHALSDGIYDQPVVDSDRQIRLIREFTVTEATLNEQLGPHWADVVTVVERFARGGFDD